MHRVVTRLLSLLPLSLALLSQTGLTAPTCGQQAAAVLRASEKKLLADEKSLIAEHPELREKLWALIQKTDKSVATQDLSRLNRQGLEESWKQLIETRRSLVEDLKRLSQEYRGYERFTQEVDYVAEKIQAATYTYQDRTSSILSKMSSSEASRGASWSNYMGDIGGYLGEIYVGTHLNFKAHAVKATSLPGLSSYSRDDLILLFKKNRNPRRLLDKEIDFVLDEGQQTWVEVKNFQSFSTSQVKSQMRDHLRLMHILRKGSKGADNRVVQLPPQDLVELRYYFIHGIDNEMAESLSDTATRIQDSLGIDRKNHIDVQFYSAR